MDTVKDNPNPKEALIKPLKPTNYNAKWAFVS